MRSRDLCSDVCSSDLSGIDRSGAWMFVIGLPLGALVVMLVSGGIDASFASPATLVVAGLAVGVGTRLGSGCTSGHGVCGVSRLSARSIVATLTFMATGIATVDRKSTRLNSSH